MQTAHLWQEEIAKKEGLIEAGFTLESPGGGRKSIYYRLPEEFGAVLTPSCDPFVTTAVFWGMRNCTKLAVHGQVSPSLLRNLEEFQGVWACWRPRNYRRFEIQADREAELERVEPEVVVMPFSGGVDSCFTAWRHRTGRAGRQNQNLQAGVMIHGFDIPLNKAETFERAAQSSRKLLESLGMELILVAHNSKELGDDPEDNHGAILAGCLRLLQGRFSQGLIASSTPYVNLLYDWQLPFGSTPITDWMLSSQSFEISEDGAGHTRIDKIQAIAEWQEAMQHLRVCLSKSGVLRERNCCRCEKCVRNILTFRMLGLGKPPAFERDASVQQILSLHYPNPVRTFYVGLLLEEARKRRVHGAWLTALKANLLFNKAKSALRQKSFWRGLRGRRRSRQVQT